MPIRELQKAGHEVAGWVYNPNIHPLGEYLRRREGAQNVARKHGIPLFFPDPDASEYDVAAWCRAALEYPAGRCAYCRASRFDAVAAAARRMGFDAFCSSLLYSRRQDHAGMREAGTDAEKRLGTVFFYRDFRPQWQEGIAASKELGIYRQQYCGCVFSEAERYAKDLAKVRSENPKP